MSLTRTGPAGRREAATTRAATTVAATLTATLACGALLLAGGTTAGASTTVPPPSPAAVQADTAQANLVAAEDARINNVRSLGALARAQRSTLVNAPYRLRTGNSYTLVLTPRPAPYTIDDLLQLAPQTFVPEPGGAYLLSENLFVAQGATLAITTTSSKLTLRLQSNPSGFVSIVSFGGALVFRGTAAAPITITSYDPVAGGPDRNVVDGRAYIRSIGGSVAMSYVHASALGFWSGRTGGVAITGNNRPHVGILGTSTAPAQTYGRNHHLGHFAVKKGSAAPPVSTPPTTAAPRTTPAGNGAIQPAGRLNPAEQATSTASPFEYVGGSVRESTFDGDAFGLFLSGAKNFLVTDSSFSHSMYAGLVVHRYVTGALIQRDVVTGSGGDGFDVTRAASAVQMLEDTATDNAGIGFSINGNPLATTESAAGMAVIAYGNHLLANSSAVGNGKAGVEVNGAVNTTVQSTRVDHSPMGIVVRGAARNLKVVSNTVNHASQHGISIRDGVSGALVEGNIVDNTGTGIYVRNSVAAVTHNSIDGGNRHAVSLVGHVGPTTVTKNAMSGLGNGAVDTFRVRASSVTVSGNDTSRWVDVRPWIRHLRQLLSPLTLLWLAVILIIGFTAIRGRRQRPAGHPYANSRPLTANSWAVPTPAAGPVAASPAPGLWVPSTIDLRSPAGAVSGPALAVGSSRGEE